MEPWRDGWYPLHFERAEELAAAIPDKSGRSAAWLARYLGVVEVVGSNPAGPILFFPGKTTLLDLVRDY